MQENLSCDFFYFFESFLELFWAAFSHPIKVDITLEFHATPSKHPKLEYHTEGITNSPIENSEGITGTKNTRCFSFEEFYWKDKSILGILVSKTTSKDCIKEVFENGGHIYMPDRKDKDKLISSGDFCLNSLPNGVRFFHICFFFVLEVTHSEISCIEIENLHGMTIFFFCFSVFLCYGMCKTM